MSKRHPRKHGDKEGEQLGAFSNPVDVVMGVAHGVLDIILCFILMLYCTFAFIIPLGPLTLRGRFHYHRKLKFRLNYVIRITWLISARAGIQTPGFLISSPSLFTPKVAELC